MIVDLFLQQCNYLNTESIKDNSCDGPGINVCNPSLPKAIRRSIYSKIQHDNNRIININQNNLEMYINNLCLKGSVINYMVDKYENHPETINNESILELNNMLHSLNKLNNASLYSINTESTEKPIVRYESSIEDILNEASESIDKVKNSIFQHLDDIESIIETYTPSDYKETMIYNKDYINRANSRELATMDHILVNVLETIKKEKDKKIETIVEEVINHHADLIAAIFNKPVPGEEYVARPLVLTDEVKRKLIDAVIMYCTIHQVDPISHLYLTNGLKGACKRLVKFTSTSIPHYNTLFTYLNKNVMDNLNISKGLNNDELNTNRVKDMNRLLAGFFKDLQLDDIYGYNKLYEDRVLLDIPCNDGVKCIVKDTGIFGNTHLMETIKVNGRKTIPIVSSGTYTEIVNAYSGYDFGNVEQITSFIKQAKAYINSIKMVPDDSEKFYNIVMVYAILLKVIDIYRNDVQRSICKLQKVLELYGTCYVNILKILGA